MLVFVDRSFKSCIIDVCSLYFFLDRLLFYVINGLEFGRFCSNIVKIEYFVVIEIYVWIDCN